MKRIIVLLMLVILTSLTSETKEHKCTATWYDTTPHRKVRREYSTAAFNHYERGTRLVVKNITNGLIDTVVITDRNGCGLNHIDLSKESFNKISNHKIGKIVVIVKKSY